MFVYLARNTLKLTSQFETFSEFKKSRAGEEIKIHVVPLLTSFPGDVTAKPHPLLSPHAALSLHTENTALQ